MDDSSLWTLLLKGNVHVLEFLYKRNYELLLNYGLKYSFDRELVKDCIHDVFIKLQKSKKLSPTSCPRSYLIKSLRNALFDKLSNQKEAFELSECVFCIPDSVDVLNRIFPKDDEELQLGKQLIEAMSHLSDNQRNVLYLRYVRDFSYNEIAEILDINVQSSMNLVSRTLRKMRSMMDNSISMAELILLINLIC